jgi:hypothetical protein
MGPLLRLGPVTRTPVASENWPFPAMLSVPLVSLNGPLRDSCHGALVLGCLRARGNGRSPRTGPSSRRRHGRPTRGDDGSTEESADADNRTGCHQTAGTS